jgi:hypothetical protein
VLHEEPNTAGPSTPDLNIYGDVDAAMDVDVSTAQRVPFDWFDGNESDDEINLVTGQCELL